MDSASGGCEGMVVRRLLDGCWSLFLGSAMEELVPAVDDVMWAYGTAFKESVVLVVAHEALFGW